MKARTRQSKATRTLAMRNNRLRFLLAGVFAMARSSKFGLRALKPRQSSQLAARAQPKHHCRACLKLRVTQTAKAKAAEDCTHSKTFGQRPRLDRACVLECVQSSAASPSPRLPATATFNRPTAPTKRGGPGPAFRRLTGPASLLHKCGYEQRASPGSCADDTLRGGRLAAPGRRHSLRGWPAERGSRRCARQLDAAARNESCAGRVRRTHEQTGGRGP